MKNDRLASSGPAVSPAPAAERRTAPAAGHRGPDSARPTPPRALPLLAVWGTVLFWGLSFVSSKTILNSGVPPMTMVCIRFLAASVILTVFLRRFDPGALLRRRDIVPLAVSGLFGVTVYFFFESRGIRLTSASHASLIIAI